MSFAPKQFIRSVDFLSTENAINTSTGCVNIYGGMSVSKDSYLTNMIVVGNSTVANLNITGALTTSNGNTLISSQWTSIDSNTDIYFGTSANAFVGIGTTTPGFNLDISGGSRITGGLTVGNLNVNTGATITNILNTTICTGTVLVSSGITTSSMYVTGGNITIQNGQFLANLGGGLNNPGFSWAGDTNVGMYRPAGDTIGLVTLGTERMRITSNGNIGIGTSTPSFTLDVTGSGDFSTFITTATLNSTNQTTTNIVGTNITGSNLRVSGTINSGDITVGNINFTGSLFQNGSAYLGSQWTTTAGNTLTYTSGNVSINSGFTSTFNSNTIGNIFTTGGNVGIGIAPTSKLQVHATDFPNIKLTTDNVYVNSIDLDSTNKTGGVYWRLMSTHQDASEGQGKFVISQVTSGLNVLGLTSSGNVGIRTLNPSTTLDVSGTGRITTSLTTGALFSTNQTTTNIVGTNMTVTNMNSSTNTIGTLNATGITTSSLLATSASIGNISAGSINLSGNMNVAGTLTVVNVTTTNLTMSNGNALLNLVTSGTIVNSGNITTSSLFSTNQTTTNIVGTNQTITNLGLTDNGAINVDSTSQGRLVLIKKVGAAPFISTNNITPLTFAASSTTDASKVTTNTYSTIMTVNTTGQLLINSISTGTLVTNNATISNLRLTSTTSIFNTVNNYSLTSGALNIFGDTVINGNEIMFTNVSIGTPTLNGRSAGSKIVLYPETNTTQGDYAIGIEGSHTWFQVPSLGAGYKFYQGTSANFIIATSGNIGIGTTAPSTLLHVNGPIMSSSQLPANQISSGVMDYSSSNNNMRFLSYGPQGTVGGFSFWTASGNVSANQVFTINSSGNVGIGITNPGQALEIGGAIKLSTNPTVTADTSAAYVWNQSSLGPCIGGLQFEVRTNGNTPRLRIDSSGNVGIGTTGPSRMLSLSGASASIASGPHIWINTSDSPTNPVFQQLNWSADNVSMNFDMYYDGAFRNSGSSTAFQIYKISNQLRFTYQNGSAGTSNGQSNSLIVGSSGNIGVSNITPLYALDISGTTRITNTSATSMGTLIVAGPGSTGYIPATATSGQLASFYGPGGAGVISNIDLSTYLPSSAAMSLPAVRFSMRDLGANNSTFDILTKNSGSTGTMASRIFIDGSGNIGINTTSPSSRLQVVMADASSTLSPSFWDSTYAVFGQAGSTGGAVALGYNSASGGCLLSLSPNIAWQPMTYRGSNHQFVLSGTVGTPPTMILTGGGNLGIGTTNPSTKLHVEDGSVFIGDLASGFSTTVPSANASVNTANGYRLFFDNSFNGTAGTGVPANKIVLHNNNWTCGFGLENSAVTYHSGQLHRFYCDTTTGYGSLALSVSSTQTVAFTNTNGEGLFKIGNSNTGNGAFGMLRVGNNLGDTVMFLNSTARTTDGGANTFTIRNDVGALRLQGFGATNTIFLPGSSTNVGINTTSPSYTLHVAGDIYATGDVISFSDSRLKTDVQTINNALDKVSDMRGVYYTNLNTQTRETGVIAQEIRDILPEVVADKGEYLGVAYGNIVGVLIEAIKELKAKVAALESRP